VDVGLHEAGRSALGSKAAPALEGRQCADSLLVKHIGEYVTNRQNNDGGYTFVQSTESNAQDTYYGLAILGFLNAPFPNVEKTIRWLHEFVPESLYHHYYVAKALELCGEDTAEKVKAFLLSRVGSKRQSATIDIHVEAASEFVTTSIVTELANTASVKIDHEKTIGWLLRYQNNDGGFGVHGYSNLNSTYHAVASLFNVGYPIKSLSGVLGYVRACEKPSGGFTVIPSSSIPYMEHVYYGASTLDLLGQHLRFPRTTGQFVLRCQNANGGFARTDLGISTFEDTFFAVDILRKIGTLKR